MIRKVLVPTDFSANAQNAARYALNLANVMQFDITFLHCTQTLVPTGKSKEAAEEGVARFRKTNEEKLKAHIDELLSEFETLHSQCSLSVADTDSITDKIASIAEEGKFDLIIMGTQGASGLKKILIGSTTARLIEKSDVPVLAVPENFVFKKPFKIGYASDLINVDGEIQEAIKFARTFDATVEIFHIYPVFPKVVSISDTHPDELVAQLKRLYHYDKINFHFIHTGGENEVKKGVQLYTEAYKPDLLLMFTHKRDFIDKVFDKSQTIEVASSLRVPLLALRYE
jgi:nucleotide-binding universal stress UspA family protein